METSLPTTQSPPVRTTQAPQNGLAFITEQAIMSMDAELSSHGTSVTQGTNLGNSATGLVPNKAGDQSAGLQSQSGLYSYFDNANSPQVGLPESRRSSNFFNAVLRS
jgi:hypothetical protein